MHETARVTHANHANLFGDSGLKPLLERISGASKKAPGQAAYAGAVFLRRLSPDHRPAVSA